MLMLLLPILRSQSESSSFLMKMFAFNINAVFLNFRSLLAHLLKISFFYSFLNTLRGSFNNGEIFLLLKMTVIY